MELENILEIYHLITNGIENIPVRKQSFFLRKNAFKTALSSGGLFKFAFDTRRIDQETELNPRRGLQNYNRSEAFLTEAMGEKLIHFAKLKNVLGNLKEVYGKEPEWQDSNARVLLSTLEKGLRTDYKDGDYTEDQPGMGSLSYIEELLHVRYRLGFDDLKKLAEKDLKKVILSKDEELTRKGVSKSLEITKNDVGTKTYDTLLEKLFSVQASETNPDIERTVTITIRDTIKK